MSKFLPLMMLLALPPLQQEEEKWERVRGIAEAQLEIVILLIKNGEFGDVIKAVDKLFRLDFPRQQEHRLVEGTQIIADSLVHKDRCDLAHDILDKALKTLESKKSRAEIYREKAYVCKVEGRDREALDLFRKAVELEQSVP